MHRYEGCRRRNDADAGWLLGAASDRYGGYDERLLHQGGAAQNEQEAQPHQEAREKGVNCKVSFTDRGGFPAT